MSLNNPILTFRSLYDEHRILWDMLRTPRYVVGLTAVRQFIPSRGFVARNYLSDQENCKIRMSNVQIIPWYAFYVTPNNAIAYSPRDPILPIANIEWGFRTFDTIRLRSKSSPSSNEGFNLDEINRQQRLLKLQNEQPVINFVDMKQQPRDASILNFNDQASDTVTTSDMTNDRNEQSALCNLNLDLTVEKNTAENILDPSIDRRAAISDPYYDSRRLDARFNSSRPKSSRAFVPRRGQFQQNWLDYLTRDTELRTNQNQDSYDNDMQIDQPSTSEQFQQQPQQFQQQQFQQQFQPQFQQQQSQPQSQPQQQQQQQPQFQQQPSQFQQLQNDFPQNLTLGQEFFEGTNDNLRNVLQT